MARTHQRPESALGRSVLDELRAFPQRFDFHQALRLLALLRPSAAPLAQGVDPSAEFVKLRAEVGLDFPASDIAELEYEDAELPQLRVSFFSLAGAHGPLPYQVTEQLLGHGARDDRAGRDFLSIFSHRLLSLVHRIRRASRVGLEVGPLESHGLARYLYAFLGLLWKAPSKQLRVPERALLRYAGLLNKKPRDLLGLRILLQDYFGVEVKCEPLRGDFRALDPDQYTRIGPGGQNQRLGESTQLGVSAWDEQAGIRICVGPLSLAQYRDFLPAQPGFVALCALVRFYIGPQLDFEVSAQLFESAPRPFPLTAQSDRAAQLGYTTWLMSTQGTAGASQQIPLALVRQFQDGSEAPHTVPPSAVPSPLATAVPPPSAQRPTPRRPPPPPPPRRGAK